MSEPRTRAETRKANGKRSLGRVTGNREHSDDASEGTHVTVHQCLECDRPGDTSFEQSESEVDQLDPNKPPAKCKRGPGRRSTVKVQPDHCMYAGGCPNALTAEEKDQNLVRCAKHRDEGKAGSRRYRDKKVSSFPILSTSFQLMLYHRNGNYFPLNPLLSPPLA